MKSDLETNARHCAACGAPRVRDQREGFCGRCLARTSLLDEWNDEMGGDELDRLLPVSTGMHPARARLGDFELLEELGRGGMGVVFKARQLSLNRIVALKMMLFGGLGDPEALARFRVEAAASAALDHPNIVHVLHIGEHDGQPFLAMQFIAGHSLASVSRDPVFDPRSAAECMAAIARAIQFAHGRGILHRDLKPSNILLDVEGNPHVSDFGLAKIVAIDSELTIAGQSLGSPNYAPPE